MLQITSASAAWQGYGTEDMGWDEIGQKTTIQGILQICKFTADELRQSYVEKKQSKR